MSRGLELAQVSQELKISPRFLQAIEDEEFDKLPGKVFAKGFVRQYARLLGQDEENAASQVERLMSPHDAAPSFVTMERPNAAPIEIEVPRMEEWQTVADKRGFSWSSPLGALALVVAAMLVCSLVYGWWQRHAAASQRTAATTHLTAPVVAQAPANPPAGEPATQPKPAASVPAVTEKSQVTSPVRSDVQTPASTVGDSPVRVELTAQDVVWVSARSDGKYSFSGTVKANETRTVEGATTVLLRIGNAGNVKITLNGKPVGEIGPKGQVRTVQFTSGGFQIVAAPPKPSDPIGFL